MENWRSQAEESSTASDNFIENISHLPQIYPILSSSQNQFSAQTLHTPHILHNPHISNYLSQTIPYQETPSTHTNHRSMTLEETMAALAAGQSLIVESMARLMTRLENVSPVQQAVNDLTAGIGNINLDRNPPPHQQFLGQTRPGNLNQSSHRQDRASYAPPSQPNFRVD